MITAKQLNPNDAPLTPEQSSNLATVVTRVNIICIRRNLPMVPTSGFRTIADHRRIYLEKARKAGIQNPRIPMGSAHLKGAAVDIFDADGALYAWCKAHESVLVEAQLWCEEGTKGWVHFQIYPPNSGKRWFLP